jgi:uncharacterized membrane protein
MFNLECKVDLIVNFFLNFIYSDHESFLPNDKSGSCCCCTRSIAYANSTCQCFHLFLLQIVHSCHRMLNRVQALLHLLLVHLSSSVSYFTYQRGENKKKNKTLRVRGREKLEKEFRSWETFLHIKSLICMTLLLLQKIWKQWQRRSTNQPKQHQQMPMKLQL